jgi:hypothetical protein
MGQGVIRKVGSKDVITIGMVKMEKLGGGGLPIGEEGLVTGWEVVCGVGSRDGDTIVRKMKGLGNGEHIARQWQWKHRVSGGLFCHRKRGRKINSLSLSISIDKIRTSSCTYIHFLSLCCLNPFHLLEELQMKSFKRYISHAILLTTLHLREMN